MRRRAWELVLQLERSYVSSHSSRSFLSCRSKSVGVGSGVTLSSMRRKCNVGHRSGGTTFFLCGGRPPRRRFNGLPGHHRTSGGGVGDNATLSDTCRCVSGNGVRARSSDSDGDRCVRSRRGGTSRNRCRNIDSRRRTWFTLDPTSRRNVEPASKIFAACWDQ